METLRSKTRITIWALYAYAYFAAISALSEALLAVTLYRQQAGGNSEVEAFSPLEVLGMLSALGYLIAFVLFGFAFLAWFYASHKRLREQGLAPKYASSWTIGGFFVPFLNLVRPYQMMKEVWQGSEHLADGKDDGS